MNMPKVVCTAENNWIRNLQIRSLANVPEWNHSVVTQNDVYNCMMQPDQIVLLSIANPLWRPAIFVSLVATIK